MHTHTNTQKNYLRGRGIGEHISTTLEVVEHTHIVPKGRGCTHTHTHT